MKQASWKINFKIVLLSTYNYPNPVSANPDLLQYPQTFYQSIMLKLAELAKAKLVAHLLIL
jgi:hypothetical protein